MVLYFIGVYIINRTSHGRLKIRNFSSRVEQIYKLFFNTRREISKILLKKYFSTLVEKFRISARPCNILYLCFFNPYVVFQILSYLLKHNILLITFDILLSDISVLLFFDSEDDFK